MLCLSFPICKLGRQECHSTISQQYCKAHLINTYKTVHDSWRGIAAKELIVMIVAYSPDARNTELGRIPEEVTL